MCPNGMLRFRDSSYQRNPRNFGTYQPQRRDPCLAPYWSTVDLDSFRDGKSFMFVYRLDDIQKDLHRLFQKAYELGKKLLRFLKRILWVVVFFWKDVRPNKPGRFGGVSFTFSLTYF